MSDPSQQISAHCKVLVVEDEYFLADDLAHAFRALGAEVLGPVPSDDKALALIEGGGVDAAVLDINLKRRSVYVLADVLRQRGVPFFFATGYDEASSPRPIGMCPDGRSRSTRGSWRKPSWRSCSPAEAARTLDSRPRTWEQPASEGEFQG